MADYTTHRRILANPEAEEAPNPTPSSMDPTLEKGPLPTSIHQSNQDPEPRIPSSRHLYMSSKPNSHLFKPIPTCKDTNLQTKGMTKSDDFDASRRSLVTKTKQQKHKTNDSKVGKDVTFRPTTKEATTKEKVKKLSYEERVEKKQVKDGLEGLDLKRISSGSGGGGSGSERRRRRSFGGAQVELGDFMVNNGVKVVTVEMPPFMQIHAVDCARKTHDSLEKFSSKTLALTLKKEFDGIYGPAWHCIVGTSFGSFVTYSVGGFLYFSMDQKLYILLFKTTVQRAD